MTDGRPHDQRISPDVVSRRLDDEVVLVHLGTNRIYRLNSTGGRYWELREEGLEQDEIMARLEEEFAVDRATLAAEIAALSGQLERQGLVVADDGR